MSDLKVVLDTSACKLYGICVSLMPDVFDTPLGSSAAVLLRATVEEDELEDLEEAVRGCPAQAISAGER